MEKFNKFAEELERNMKKDKEFCRVCGKEIGSRGCDNPNCLLNLENGKYSHLV